MTKENFKNKLEGNELDLSVLGLDEVPVKEIASLVKATHIDLSCNRILNIPSSFCGLQQIVKLDLSKNVIESLPFNFGDLSKLQYLDLDSNRIMMLPISFGNLKSLRWLDLKKNPLDPQLKAIAGDCVDAKQCQNCAKRVVKFMQKVEEQYLLEDQRNQKQFEEVKDNLKAERLKKEEKQTVNKKATNEKKTTTTGQKKNQLHQTVTESKEKSNRNEKQKKVTQVVQQRSKVTLNETLPQQNGKRKTNEKKQPTKSSSLSNKKSKAKSNNKTSKSWSFFTLLLASVFLLATTLAAVLCFYTGGDMSSEAIQKAIPNVKADVAKLVDVAEMKLNDFIGWVKTDGRKTFSWATEIVISFCGDLLEISIQCFSHAKENSEHFFGLLKKWIESSSTITTTTPPNAKPM